MKLNEEKCHYIISGHKYEHTWVKLNNEKCWECDNVKLLGIDIDSTLRLTTMSLLFVLKRAENILLYDVY